MKDAKILSYIPGPGQYNANKSTLDPRASSLRSRLPDSSQNHLIKVYISSFSFLALVLTTVTKWAAKCIMQLPNFVTQPITKLLLVLDFLRSPVDQLSKLVLQVTRQMFRT